MIESALIAIVERPSGGAKTSVQNDWRIRRARVVAPGRLLPYLIPHEPWRPRRSALESYEESMSSVNPETISATLIQRIG